MQKKYVISIVGTTAIGKTALSIKLANAFDCEIISADSRQFFKEMTIGTAVPSTKELASAKHHFIQHISIHDHYSVGDFEKDALQKITQLHKNNNIVIMVGGSGLYVNAVLNGLDTFPKVDKQIRQDLQTQLESNGLESLQLKLKKLDPITYKKIALDNPQRVMRALEVCISSGKPYSSFLNKAKEKREFIPISIGLNAERQEIYNRINKRVDIMVANGLIEEARGLYKNRNLNALQTVGYKELFAYFDGDYSQEFAIEEIKKNTRRFAKRQITWFKKNEETKWFNYLENKNSMIDFVKQKNENLKRV